MAIVINDPFARGGGGVAGQEFGNIISSGLQQLAQHKMTQIQQRNQAKVFQGAGYTPQEAALLAQFQGSPETQRKLLQSLGMGQPQEQMQEQMPMQQALQQFSQPQGPKVSPFANEVDSLEPEFLGQQSQVQQPQQQVAPQQQQQVAQPKTTRERIAGYQTPQMQQAEKFHNEKVALKEREIARPVIKEIGEKRNAIKQQNAALDRQLKLSETGKVNDPGWLTLLKTTGLDYPVLKNPGTAEFDALGVNFLTNLKSYFGARPTNFDVGTYLNKLAKSIDTKEGRKALITNYKRMLKAESLTNDAKMQIIRENNNIVPVDLDFQAQDRTEKQLDKLWDEFVNTAEEAGERRSFEMMPKDLSEFEGKTIRDTKTGATFKIENGKRVKV